MGEWMYRSTIVYLSTSWRWVISFKPLPLYPWRKNPLYPLDRKFGGPMSTIWRCEYFLPYQDSNSDPSVIQRVANHYTDWTTTTHLSGTNVPSKGWDMSRAWYFNCSEGISWCGWDPQSHLCFDSDTILTASSQEHFSLCSRYVFAVSSCSLW
jgi:hypothetical protein